MLHRNNAAGIAAFIKNKKQQEISHMKISEFIERYVSSHTIYEDEDLRERFLRGTGFEPAWTAHDPIDCIEALDNISITCMVAYGYEVAEQTARKYIHGYNNNLHGRGFRYNHAVKALKENNL